MAGNPDQNRHSLTFWLLKGGQDVPDNLQRVLTHRYYESAPILIAGLVNTAAVSVAVAFRIGTTPFIVWAAIELLLCLFRGTLLIARRRALARNKPAPARLPALFSLGWAASVGYGIFICMVSGDWVASTLVCLSAAAMVGGLCFRYFAMPRVLAAMIVLSLGPCVLGALLSGEPILFLIVLQLPVYAVMMTFAAVQMNDVMVRTMLAEQENDRRARHDGLTGLLNRAGLARKLAEKTAKGSRFALLYLDLDGFKAVNDSFGHQAGDELLKAVAERLRGASRPEDAVARIGGDEFVVLTSIGDVGAAKAFGERLIETVGEAFFIGSEAAFVGVSIGVALCPDHGGDLGSLLGEADAALYQAKYWGRARCVVARAGVVRPAVADRLPVSRAVAQRRMVERDAA